MYEFWYDHIKPKYRKKQNCVIWMQVALQSAQKQIIFCKTDKTKIEEDVETRFDSSRYEI